MRLTIILLAFLFSIIFISAASAEIMISQPKTTYTIGENLDLSVKVSEGGEEFKAELVCTNENKLILFKNLGLDETSVNIFQPLTKSFLEDMQGICHISIEYFEEKTNSQDFKISGNINIILNIGVINYNAGENITITGEATKENSVPVEGFVEIMLQGTNIKLVNSVQKGKFSSNFLLPDNLVAGQYTLKARVYEKDTKGRISNEGEETLIIGIKQEAKKLEIAINQQEIEPGQKLNFRVFLYDQANNEMSGDASVVVKDLDDKEVLKKLVKTNEELTLDIETNATPGYWKIEASCQGINSKRLFSVEENEEASFSLANDTLIITNIGNVLYRKTIQIAIGGEVEIKELFLEVGEDKRFRLLAPDGNYQISVTDGYTTFSQGDVSLTGNVVGIQDIRKSLGVWRKYPIIWLFLIVVLGLSILMLVQRTLKKRSYAYPVKEKYKKSKSIREEPEHKIRGKKGFLGLGALGILDALKRKPSSQSHPSQSSQKAEHSLVLGGKKQDVALICLKIKNKEEISNETEANLEQAFQEAYELKAVPYKTNNYIFLIFSPLITKTFQNYTNAVKAAQSITKALQEYNSKFREKIDFGISIHCGELVNKIEEGKLKFTSLGSTLNKAKKLAELSDQEPLLSKELHEKTRSDVRTEKAELKGKIQTEGKEPEAYTAKKVEDNKRNKEFVRDFLKRTNEEKES